MKFKKPFEVYKSKACPAGNPIKDEFELVIDGNNMTLKKTGTVNVQKMIDSYRDSVDLGKMIERYKRGDVTALKKGNGGFFADTTGITADLAETIENNRLAAEYIAQANEKKAAEKAADEEAEETAKEDVNNG